MGFPVTESHVKISTSATKAHVTQMLHVSTQMVFFKYLFIKQSSFRIRDDQGEKLTNRRKNSTNSKKFGKVQKVSKFSKIREN